MSILDQRLDQLDFGPGYTVRLRNRFENFQKLAFEGGHWEYRDAPLITVRDLIALSEADILRMPNIGRQSLLRLKAMLAPHGLHFGMPFTDGALWDKIHWHATIAFTDPATLPK